MGACPTRMQVLDISINSWNQTVLVPLAHGFDPTEGLGFRSPAYPQRMNLTHEVNNNNLTLSNRGPKQGVRLTP